MNTFISHPEEGGPYPIILFLMDAPGYREELQDMARRIATAGYYVMLPNLYYRRTRGFAIDSSPQSREVMFGHMNSLSNSMGIILGNNFHHDLVRPGISLYGGCLLYTSDAADE